MSYRALYLIAGVCHANFLIFCVAAVAIGRDALNGKIVDGHFYLGSHERFTEVSQALWHALSLIVTHPTGMLTALPARSVPDSGHSN
jgi:hypothetical protein